MNIKFINDSLSVAPQIDIDQLSMIRAAGFQSIICNRPDAEAEDQPDFTRIATAAEKLGIKMIYQPIVSGTHTQKDADAFGKLLNELPQPILAYCRTGTRCTQMWGLSQSVQFRSADILQVASTAGYDLSSFKDRFDENFTQGQA